MFLARKNAHMTTPEKALPGRDTPMPVPQKHFVNGHPLRPPFPDHLEQAQLQLSREPRPLPVMRLEPTIHELSDYRYEHFRLENYDPHPHIAAPVAV